MRVAFYSPLNPSPSGIADYAEELLPLLAQELEITLILEGRQPANPLLAPFPKLDRRELPAHERDFDLILYQMGNSPAHDRIYEMLLERPGVVVLHDVVLHHLRAWQTLDRGDSAGYVKAMRDEYGEPGAELARQEAQRLTVLNRFDFPLNGQVVRAARALMVHSEYAARQIQPLAPQTPVAVIPMGVPPARPMPAVEARDRMHLPARAFVVAAFGQVGAHKRVTVALEAFAEFQASFPDSLFLLIGRESPNFETASLIRTLGLGNAVRPVGFAPRAEYEDGIAAADLCLNLRYPTAGESSASLLRLFAAGKAVIVTRAAAYAELPDSVCAKVEADEYERELLFAHFQFLARRPDLRAQLGANAQSFAASCHTLEQSASAYADFLRAVHERRARSKSYLSSWSPRAAQSALLGGQAPDAGQPPSDGRPAKPTSETDSVGLGLREEIARAYVELGFDAGDDTLRAVARAKVELGLDED